MLRNLVKANFLKSAFPRRNFLTKEYKCKDAWNSQISSQTLQKINLDDFYNLLDQNYSSKGVISAIDVDIFANRINNSSHLEELKDLLHKLRLSAETGSTLESTHHATVRNYMEYGTIEELVDILKDPLNFGIFLDNYSANILLDKLLTTEDYTAAANVASLIMLQEEYSNEITCALCQYACYNYIMNYTPKEETNVPAQDVKKPEEIKIRVKFLRNPYFDDHFDIKDIYTLSGKTLAWISKVSPDNVSNNLQIIGWLVYKKYEKLVDFCQDFSNINTSKTFTELMSILNRECKNADETSKVSIEKSISMLSKVSQAEGSLKDALKIKIENAINSTQNKDIAQQHKIFDLWAKIREEKINEQTKRLDRAKRMQLIEEKQKKLKDEEQKLWFFENEEQIDLEIEEKEKLDILTQKKESKASDENYIPPEILPKRK